MRNRLLTVVMVLIFGYLNVTVLPGNSQEETVGPDWTKLNLTGEQSRTILQLDAEWQRDYSSIKPTLLDEQARFANLLETYNSDPLEIIALQESICRKRSQLATIATANFLKKRQILDANQQHNLTMMMHDFVEKEKASNGLTFKTDSNANDRLQDLMQKARSVWSAPHGH